jgi:hypothetical protein
VHRGVTVIRNQGTLLVGVVALAWGIEFVGGVVLIVSDHWVLGATLLILGNVLWLVAKRPMHRESHKEDGASSGNRATLRDDVAIQVRVPRSLVRFLRYRPFTLGIGALTGVSVAASPIGFVLGRTSASMADSRVVLCFVIAVLVSLVYVKLGSLVIQAAQEVGFSARPD